jgi:DNA-binding PadR family transcriptional regulator
MADVLGVFEQAVLVAVHHLRGDGYGRTVLKDVERRLDRDVTASAVYATLDRLEAKGLVASRPGDATPERGGRARRHFTVTAAGMRALNDARQTSLNIWRGITGTLKGRA